MALYLDAAKVLEGPPRQGSLKSRIYGPDVHLKSKPTHVYALVSEVAKYSPLLKEVIDNAGFLQHEPKVSPLLALLLVHDLLFAKGGIAASAGHHLRQAIEKHRSRLHAELTKIRVRRKYATVQALQDALAEERARSDVHPNRVRWVRVNKSSVEEQLQSTFLGYKAAEDISEVSNASALTRILTVDKNVPGLLGLPPDLDLSRTKAYIDGQLILQDKASCFPAHLLLGSHSARVGDIVDACAAPGNKTTHLAAISTRSSTIFACERNSSRSETLQSMVERAGAGNVTVLAKQDFLALNPYDPRFSNVTHLLLDPSCSGSGILRREDVPKLMLPEDLRSSRPIPNSAKHGSNKRKRKLSLEPTEDVPDGRNEERHENAMSSAQSNTRLEKLSNLQTQIIAHAFQFPSAIRVSYSTCSLNVQENEAVVARVLSTGKWKLLPRGEQVQGLSDWPHRGVRTREQISIPSLSDDELEACIRCWPGSGECTMGFFTCCFVRDDLLKSRDDRCGEDEWEGFSDHD